MNTCTKWLKETEICVRHAPAIVPLSMIVIALVLLPIESILVQAFAVMLIVIGGYSLYGHLSRLYCCIKNRSARLAEGSDSKTPCCF